MSNVICVDFGERRRMTHQDRVAQARFAYESASAIDENGDAQSAIKAEKLYRRAIELDPTYALAYTNLGRVRFLRGAVDEAESLFRRASEIDTTQPEAHYNLGFVLLESGRTREAVSYFQRAIECDAKFADAHYNLAAAWDRLGQGLLTRAHLKKYLALEPRGPWADAARGQLERYR